MGTLSKMDQFMVGEEATHSETDLQTDPRGASDSRSYFLHFTSSQGNNVQQEAEGLTFPNIHATRNGDSRPRHLTVKSPGPATRNGTFRLPATSLLHVRELASLP